MADDVTDNWTKWLDLQDHIACPDIEHLKSCFILYTIFSWDYDTSRSGFDLRIGNARTSWLAGDDHAAIGDLIVCCKMLSNMVNITRGAAMDCRLLLAGLELTKEVVFDLWLERAAEMIV